MIKESYSLNRLGPKRERINCIRSIRDAKVLAQSLNPKLKWEGTVGEQVVDGDTVDMFCIEMPVYLYFGRFIWMHATE